MHEQSYERQRAEMVAQQIAGRGVCDERVLAAMRKVPRHMFVPADVRAHAYEDRPLPIGYGQTISQPYMVGMMTELLRLRSEHRVLEVGTGSGYQAAILGELSGRVITVERIPELAALAEMRLRELGYGNVEVCVGDGTLGYAEKGPYDAIVVTAAGPDVPNTLKQQLSVEGRLLCPAGPRDSQRLELVVRSSEGFTAKLGVGCVFVPLIGSQGWPN